MRQTMSAGAPHHSQMAPAGDHATAAPARPAPRQAAQMQAAGSPAMASTCSASDCRVSRATATHPDVVLMASPTQHAGRHATMTAAPSTPSRIRCQSAAVGAPEQE